jgi:DNA-binding LytR/AlgR family response regulator
MTKSEFKILIVDDEVLIAYHIQKILKTSTFENSRMTHNKNNALLEIETFKPNLVLLDIRMEEDQTGIEIGKYLNENFASIPFIYLTAHSDIVLMEQAFETNPFAYLTKPIKKADLFASVMLAYKANKITLDYFFIKDATGQVKVFYKELLFVKSENNYLEIHTFSKKYNIRMTLERFKIDFPFSDIIQTHRAYLINKTHIEKIEGNTLFIQGIQIPISRKYKDEVRNLVLKNS